MEQVNVEFKPAYNLAKFFGDFVLSFNIEFGDDLDKTLSAYIKGGSKVSPLVFDFLKQLQIILDCKGRGQLAYHNNMNDDAGNRREFSLSKFREIFIFSFNRHLANELSELFQDIVNIKKVPPVIYSFMMKFQDLISFNKGLDKTYPARPVRDWAEILHG